MRSINKVILIGNLTRDASVRTTPQGIKFVTFGVATNRAVVTKEGERRQLTEFIECCTFKPWIVKLADSGALVKGKYLYLEGYLKTRFWDGPDGKRVYRTECIIDQDLIMLTPNPGRGSHHSSHTEGDEGAAMGAEEMLIAESLPVDAMDVTDEDLF